MVAAVVARAAAATSRASGRTCPSPTARRPRTAPSPRASSTSSTRLVAGLAADGVHAARAARRQHGRRRRLPPVAPRHGALRARPLRLPAGSRRVRLAFDAPAGGDAAAAGHVAQGRASSPCARSRPGERPSYGRLRPLPARSLVATVPIGYADGVPRALFDAGYEVLIGGVRRPAGRDGDHGPDRGRLRRRRLGAAGRRGGAARPPGRRGDHGGRLGGLLGTISYEVVCGVGPRMPRVARQPPRRARWLTPTLLERLRLTASTCTLCPLAKGRTQVVFGVGDPAADLLFVGEGPGREEDLAGEPFVGRSGKLLDRLMREEIGLTRAECYIANVVKCRPPQNRDPAPDEIEACRPYLDEQIVAHRPDRDRHPGQLRHQAAAREHTGHPRAAGPGLSTADGPASSRRTTPPTCCAPGARPWPRCGPTSSGPSASWRRGDGRDAGRSSARPRLARPPPGQLAGRLARLCRAGDVVLLVGEPRGRQDGVRPGLRRRAGRGGPGDQPDLRPGAPLPLRRRAARSGSLIHADVYRTGSVAEVADLALAELVEEDAVAVVEWGDLAAPALGDSALVVTLGVPDPVGPPTGATVTMVGRGGWAAGPTRSRRRWSRRSEPGRREPGPGGRAVPGGGDRDRRPRPSASPCGRPRACRPSSP